DGKPVQTARGPEGQWTPAARTRRGARSHRQRHGRGPAVRGRPRSVGRVGMSSHTNVVRVAVLGSTGSIGLSTLDVLERNRDRYRVFALAAHSSREQLREQCLRHAPAFAALADPEAAQRLADDLLAAGSPTRVLAGPEALAEIAAHPEVDAVMAAIVGAAGLPSSLAAARAGKRILLANKEALVMSGPLFM